MATPLSRLMKKVSASSSVIYPLANRTTLLKNHTTAILTASLKTSEPNLARQVFRTASVPSRHGFSALAENRSILSLIECDLDCAEKKSREVAEAAREFPFKIVDDEKEQCITLTREYKGEEIEVVVYEGDWGRIKGDPRRVIFSVSTSKRSGRTLRFYGKADATDGITLESFSVRRSNDRMHYYREPDLLNLFKNLHKGFHTYLEVRGIEPSFTKFLCDYMAQRKHMRYRTLLEDLKTFLDN